MKDNNLLKFLIPLVAVVVIAESVMIVFGLDKKQPIAEETTPALVEDQITNKVVTPVVTVKQEPVVAEVLFSVDSTLMKIGKPSKVTVSLLPKKDLSVDAVDLYVKYNANGLDVSSPVSDKMAPKPQFIKVSKDKGLVVANYLISEAKGWQLVGGRVAGLLSFVVTPKVEGSYVFEIGSGNSNLVSATMIVENGTARVLPFSSSKLEIKASK